MGVFFFPSLIISISPPDDTSWSRLNFQYFSCQSNYPPTSRCLIDARQEQNYRLPNVPLHTIAYHTTCNEVSLLQCASPHSKKRASPVSRGLASRAAVQNTLAHTRGILPVAAPQSSGAGCLTCGAPGRVHEPFCCCQFLRCSCFADRDFRCGLLFCFAFLSIFRG